MKNIHPVLRRLDLNLLLLFDALFRRRSVLAAADELVISASACSHALARLRQALADDLFIRVGAEMRPTQRAETMAPAVAAALALLSDGLTQGADFDPVDSDRVFVFAATDYTTFAILPQFLRRMQQLAPRLRFRVVQTGQKVPLQELLAGSIDFALGYSEEQGGLPPGIDDFDWFSDDYVAIASKNHPAIRERLTLRQYLQARHVVVTPWNEARGVVDHVLDTLGLAREVAVQVPSVLAAPFIIADTDLVMTLPQLAVKTLAAAVPVNIFPAPFAIPPYRLKVYCHARHARATAHDWVRRQLLACKPGR
ncbi:LysR family transcriptional regulator [Chromobacterium sphagni]|uniref:LysR family transcriptional regulator n=1 Tax=Chromobacterium sphagni TaxID=1903179 RepID=A0ABX3CA06_9NEIS|nr:LysR family transcriptional regulator [Chromobacterium sphagni]OHX19013.1 LysR family transcriptional regulator [Chromobacterium sphagni]